MKNTLETLTQINKKKQNLVVRFITFLPSVFKQTPKKTVPVPIIEAPFLRQTHKHSRCVGRNFQKFRIHTIYNSYKSNKDKVAGKEFKN